MEELHVPHNNFGRKRSSRKEWTVNAQNEEELEEASNSHASEEDEDENINNAPITIQDTHMKGAIEDACQHPLLHLFKVPFDNDNALHHLHFELSEILKNNDDSIECMNPVNNKKIHHIMLHQGNSTSTNKKKKTEN